MLDYACIKNKFICNQKNAEIAGKSHCNVSSDIQVEPLGATERHRLDRCFAIINSNQSVSVVID